MSHHGDNPEKMHLMHEAMKKVFGEFPDGKLNQHDEGGIAMAVSNEKGRVTISFPKPIKWIGLTADETIELAELLVTHARQCGSVKPLTFKVG